MENSIKLTVNAQSNFVDNSLIPSGKYLLKQYKDDPIKTINRVVGY